MLILIQSLILDISNELSEDGGAAGSQVNPFSSKHWRVYRKMIKE